MCEDTQPEWVALREVNGRVHMVELRDETRKIKGLGVLNPVKMLSGCKNGEKIGVGSKELTLLTPRLPEMIAGMQRRAQTISSKDAGLFITKLGIGPGDRVLEAGLGSAGLSLHLSRVLGSSGTLVNIEHREEHATVGMANLARAKSTWQQFPQHHLIIGDIAEKASQASEITKGFDAVILDLPEHVPAIIACAPYLGAGGRIACYCPVSSQLEDAWQTCEENGLQVEWAGELMAREWGRAGKGGMRPVNGPFGHTAFLLIAIKV